MNDDSDSFIYDNDADDFDFEEDTDEAIVIGNYTTGDGMDDFEFIDTERSKKKVYEVDFKILDTEQLVLLQKNEIAEASAILGTSDEHTRALLRAFRWNKEKVIETVMDSPEKAYKKAGLEKIIESRIQPSITTEPDFSCFICCEESSDQEIVQLECGEIYCLNCHKTFYEQNIVEGNARSILCVGSCGTLVQDEILKKIISPEVFQKFIALQNNYFVDDNKNLKWCPAPDCIYVAQCDVPLSSLSSTIPSIQCICGHQFCFGCTIGEHLPTLCALGKLWVKKCQDDSETANWIHANTKECPKCFSTIEKNGGCNHMSCRKCAYEFCWVCMGLWSNHGQAWYNCNRFEEKDSTDNRDKQAQSRASLERYLHYYNRYINHIQSAKLDQELYARTEEKMEEMQKTSELSWIEVQFLKSAVDTLVQCRHTLKWTYALAFYLKHDNQTYIFESNQQDLELATEALSGLLEEPIEPESILQLKQMVQDKAKYVSQRRDVLLADLIKGHTEGRWNYTIKF
ncbi:hypothetical protein DSO57_1027261 [Entomophthora muscae]|uniref:Uncharacterized protein n=1 Tax=Entomophthora muscae TaxID=34485 RepID=A0ACC2U0A7_9FUNG|nr:hypothetical protein DSO57_1027261 [Entomophthora muscae]